MSSPAPAKSHSTVSSRATRLADGCHRWGWVINIIITFITFAYFFGEFHSTVASMNERLQRIEATIDGVVVRSLTKDHDR